MGSPRIRERLRAFEGWPGLGMLAAALGGLVLFQLMFGLDLIWAGAPYWIEPRGDMAVMMAGHQALLQDQWRFPLATTDRLRAPDIVSIVYSDSLPWLTVAMKATGLGGWINPLGLFLALSYVLQPVAMIALLKSLGARRLATLAAGAALALLTPAWIARQFGHIALSAHWLILLGLTLSVGSARFGLTRGRIAGFAGLAALASGVHAYHLPPIAVCLAAAMVSEILQRRAGGWLRCAAAALAVGGATGLSAWVLGYGIGQGPAVGGAAMGLWSMNILAPVLPQASALAGHTFDGTWFNGTIDPNGGQAFEGYNYLGAGVLAALGLSLVLGLRDLHARPAAATWSLRLARFGPLAVGLLLLTAWAVGPQAYLGERLLFRLPHPEGVLGDALGLFRAHGRFFWTAGYVLTALALLRIDRLAARSCALACIAAVALQAVDVSFLQQGARAAFQPQRAFYKEAALFRTSPAFEARPWRFFPLVECADWSTGAVTGQLSALAIRRGGISSSAPLARGQTRACSEIPQEALVDAAPEDRWLTLVIGAFGQPDGLLERFWRRTDCRSFSRGLVCGQGLDETGLPARRVPPPPTTAATDFGQGLRPPILGSGWSVPEPGGIWSAARTATLIFPPSLAPNGRPFQFEIEASGYMPDGATPQPVHVSMNGRRLGTLQVFSGLYRLTAPARADPDAPIEITLDIPGARAASPPSPKPPDRLLGIFVRKVAIVS